MTETARQESRPWQRKTLLSLGSSKTSWRELAPLKLMTFSHFGHDWRGAANDRYRWKADLDHCLKAQDTCQTLYAGVTRMINSVHDRNYFEIERTDLVEAGDVDAIFVPF